MKIKDINNFTTLRVSFKDDSGNMPGVDANLDVRCGEMEDAGDPLLIGFPDLLNLAPKFERDEDGHVWVEFKNRVRLLCEAPTGATGCALKVGSAKRVVGPVEEVMDACFVGEPEGRWILDADWPGVKVVQQPLIKGVQKLMLVVEPHAEVIVGSGGVPWTIGVPSHTVLAKRRAANDAA